MAGATSGVLLPCGNFATFILHVSEPNAAVYGIGNAGVLPLVGAWYGQYKVEGHCKLTGPATALYRRVVLATPEGILLRTAWTNFSTGAYSFISLPAGTYTVLGIDQNGVQNDVVAALITAVAM